MSAGPVPRTSGAGPKPMRVLYVSPHAELGGAERVTVDLMALHDRSVVEPSVCFLRDGPLVQHCREVLGVQTYQVHAPAGRRFLAGRKMVRTLSDLITAGHVDLVHSVMAWGHIYGGRAARRARRPSVWFQHVGASWSSRVEAWAALIRTDTIIACSAFTAEGQRRVNPRRARIAVVHPGTRLPDEPWDVRRQRARAALGLRGEEFAVGIAARLQPWKGQDVVLRAAATLLHAREQARLFVIGDAKFGLDQEYAASLPRLARELGISERVSLMGFRPDVLDLLSGLDVAVHASTTPEPFGLALIEAMAAGTALVAADAGGAREIVTHGENGLLVAPGDHEALAVALLMLCDDAEQRDRLAEAGEHTAFARFGAAEMTRKVEAIYRDILKR